MATTTKRRALTATLERWSNAVRVLDTVIAQGKPFDIGVWCDVHIAEKPSVFEYPILEIVSVDMDCDTVACAAGYIGRDPWFHARHFHTENDFEGGYIWFRDGRERVRDDEALRRFFDPLGCITVESSGDARITNAADLFHFYSYDTADVTADLVRQRMVTVIETAFHTTFHGGVFQETLLTHALLAEKGARRATHS